MQDPLADAIASDKAHPQAAASVHDSHGYMLQGQVNSWYCVYR